MKQTIKDRILAFFSAIPNSILCLIGFCAPMAFGFVKLHNTLQDFGLAS